MVVAKTLDVCILLWSMFVGMCTTLEFINVDEKSYVMNIFWMTLIISLFIFARGDFFGYLRGKGKFDESTSVSFHFFDCVIRGSVALFICKKRGKKKP